MASDLNLSQTMVHLILKDELKVWQVCSTWVPHFLTREQMDNRVYISKEILGMLEKDPPHMLKRVIMGDEA